MDARGDRRRGEDGREGEALTTCETLLPAIFAQCVIISLYTWLASFFRPEFAAYRRPAEISVIVEGAIVAALVVVAIVFSIAERLRERREVARARRCWERFSRGTGPRAFAREGGEVLVVAVPGVLAALGGIPDLKRRTAYAAYCSGVRNPGGLPAEWGWAAWPYRYRDRVRVWAFAASDLEEVEARFPAAGLQKLAPGEFWEPVRDRLAFLRQWPRVAADRTGPEGGNAVFALVRFFLLVSAGAAATGALLGLLSGGGPTRLALRAAGIAWTFLLGTYLVSEGAARIFVWRRRGRVAPRTAAVRGLRPAARREEGDLP